MIKKILTENRVFLITLLTIILTAYITNNFLSKNTIVQAGEYIFSFDYLGHLQNILTDPRSVPAEDYTNCFDCPDFYHYSRWYSTFKIGYHSLSQIIGLHPFIFLILSMVVTQLTSLYIFVRVLFKKFSWGPFLISSFVFIFYPYKYSLLVETHDGLLYSCMLIFLTLIMWTLTNVAKLTFRKIVLLGLLTGLVFSTFLNVNIAFFPIAFYAAIIVGLFNRNKIVTHFKKTAAYAGSISIPSTIINLPLLGSLSKYGNSRHYEGYISFDFVDSSMAGLHTANTDNFIIICFAILFIFIFIYAPMNLRKKLILFGVYVLTTLIIMGKNSPINIYGWLFNNVPLIDSLRATYRFMFFEFIIIFVVTYLSLQKLQANGLYKKILFIFLSLSLVYLTLSHIYTQRDYFFVTELPAEYFSAQKFVNNLEGKKVYFPPTTQLFHSISTDYSWVDTGYNQSILLYKNPYTSLLPIKNLMQFERFPYLLSPPYLELRYLTDLRHSPENIVKAMELRGIRYVIFDQNYKWKNNYPDFDVDKFIGMTSIEKKFGNIHVLKLSEKSSSCKKGYGTISLEYCTSHKPDAKLINRTREEFLLETTPETIAKKITLRKNTIYTKSVLDPILHQVFIDNRILFNSEIMQVFGDQKNVFTTQPLRKGDYTLYVSVFKYTREKNLMGKATIVVRSTQKVIKNISPYADKPGIYWEKINFLVNDGEIVRIDLDNEGYIIFGYLPLIKAL